MQEKWKDIEGYEGLYQVSNIGRIKSLERYKKNHSKMKKVEEKILAQTKDKNEYFTVLLSRDGKSKRFKVHRLVANAFIINTDGLLEVNHKNGIKTDNKLENLEWCSRNENMQHASKMNLMKPCIGNNNPLSKTIIQYDKDMNKIAEYGCIREIERKTRYRNQNISHCCNGKFKTAYGYIWRFKEE